MQAKQALSLASLVAAVPAAVLAYFLVMVFLNFSENMSGMMMGIVAVTLISCAILLFIPVAAMVFGGRKSEPSAVVADDEEAVVETKKSKKKSKKDEDEPEATFISDATIELDEEAMSADEDLDDFETFDDLDDDRK